MPTSNEKSEFLILMFYWLLKVSIQLISELAIQW